MASFLFVHGTGVREPHASKTLQVIESKIRQNTQLKNIRLFQACLWGDEFGVKLHADGASIPTYNQTKGIDSESSLSDDETIAWSRLYQDPFCELRLVASMPASEISGFSLGQLNRRDELVKHIKEMSFPIKLQELLDLCEIEDMVQSLDEVVDSQEYSLLPDLVDGTPVDQEKYLSRAAFALSLSRLSFGTRGRYDAALRDRTVAALIECLTVTQTKGFGDRTKEVVKAAVLRLVTNKATRKRGMLSDAVYPGVGDIISYQTRGDALLNFIRKHVESIPDDNLILIGHSLGGIMCFDLLVTYNIPKVKLFVTVGSQAPALYEMNSLRSLEFGATLPQHFPEWVNFYDLTDLLSYVGESLFPGRVQDVLVDNRQSFPDSHCAYWFNDELWEKLISLMPQAVAEIGT